VACFRLAFLLFVCFGPYGVRKSFVAVTVVTVPEPDAVFRSRIYHSEVLCRYSLDLGDLCLLDYLTVKGIDLRLDVRILLCENVVLVLEDRSVGSHSYQHEHSQHDHCKKLDQAFPVRPYPVGAYSVEYDPFFP
jgi:hypothetical protein